MKELMMCSFEKYETSFIWSVMRLSCRLIPHILHSRVYSTRSEFPNPPNASGMSDKKDKVRLQPFLSNNPRILLEQSLKNII